MLGRSVIDQKYIEQCVNPSDINEHLPTLARYASQCKHVTECGPRYFITSYALAHGLRNQKDSVFVQVDNTNNISSNSFKEECEKEGVCVRFHNSSSLQCPIETTDLLFIDTWHVYGQLKRELARWNEYVAKYIIMHDTTIDEWAGETIRLKWNPKEQSRASGIPVHEITKGVWPAIREFLKEHPEWVLRERYSNNNGLTILERVSSDNLKDLHEIELPTPERIYPISFSIPKSKIRENVPTKVKNIAESLPDGRSFCCEKSYYDEYGRSVFGITRKKGGWDCMRHYEILANGCIPKFENLEACPTNTMTHFPKQLVMSAMNEINNEVISKYSNELLNYTREHLTTEKMASYILEKSGNTGIKSVLYLSQQQFPDYMRCLTLHGFKELFKTDCHDVPRIDHMYKDYEGNTDSLYGMGFTYSRTLDSSMRDSTRDTNVESDIRNKKYDIVVYGSVHRGMPYWDLVKEVYPKDKIIMICGEDIHDATQCKNYGVEGYHTFIRELE